MKAMRNVLLAALAITAVALAGPAAAQHRGGGGHSSGGGHWSGGGHYGGSHYGGGHYGGSHYGGGHYGGGHYGGGHYGGGHYGGWGGWSFYLGVPFYWPSYYYGYYGGPYYSPYYSYPYSYSYPYYYDQGYPAYPQSYPRTPMDEDLGPTAQVAPGPGAPTEGPLYMNYCESAKAYYPKVTQCAEGWKFIAPTR